MATKQYNYKTDGNPINLIPAQGGGHSLAVYDARDRVEVIFSRDVTYEELFTVVDGVVTERKQLIIRSEDTKKYRKILLFATSSYPEPFDIRCYEREYGVYSMATWDGEKFDIKELGEQVIIPLVTTAASSTPVTSKFPIHHAVRFLQDGICHLEIRIRCLGDSPKFHLNTATPYTLTLLLMGVR